MARSRLIETSEAGSPDHAGWWFRVVGGGFGTGEQTRIWTRETTRLVDDEPVSPFVRTALSGDIACPLANSSDHGLHYINADYTMLIGRYPVGEWVGLEVAQQIDADGISMGSATLVDRTGPFATSGGVSLARPPMVTAPRVPICSRCSVPVETDRAAPPHGRIYALDLRRQQPRLRARHLRRHRGTRT